MVVELLVALTRSAGYPTPGTVLTAASDHCRKVTYSPFEGFILQLTSGEFNFVSLCLCGYYIETMMKQGKSRAGLLYASVFAVILVFLGAIIHGSFTVNGIYQSTASMTEFAGGTFEASGVVHVPGSDGVLFVDDDHPEEVFFMRIGQDLSKPDRSLR